MKYVEIGLIYEGDRNFIVNPNDTNIFNKITKYLLLAARTAACEETKAKPRYKV